MVVDSHVRKKGYRDYDPVTYSKFRPGKTLQLQCGHVFSHDTIIRGVLNSNEPGKCPLCRHQSDPIKISLRLQYIRLDCKHLLSPVTARKMLSKDINICPVKNCYKKFSLQIVRYLLNKTQLGCGCEKSFNYQTCLNMMRNLRWNHCPNCDEHIDKDFLNFKLRNITLDCGHEFYWEYLVDKEVCPEMDCGCKIAIDELLESGILTEVFPGFDH